MVNSKISTNEVKRYFLLANAGKRLLWAGVSRLEEEYNHVLDEIFGLNDLELDERITDKIRLARYKSFDWYKGQSRLSEIGPWPKMKSLDIRLTTGNILETAQAVKEYGEGRRLLFYSDEKEKEKRTNAFRQFIEKSKSIRDNLDFVYERFPIILFPGGEIREKDYNCWARENNAPLCRVFKQDLDGGNARAVSYALEGIIEIPCFYGISEEDLFSKPAKT